MQSYLDHHADKLADRFDAGTYVALTDATTTHDVARGRGSREQVLAGITVPVPVAGLDTDRLYPLAQQQLADEITRCPGLEVIETPFGHDGFLIESDRVGQIVGATLAAAADPSHCREQRRSGGAKTTAPTDDPTPVVERSRDHRTHRPHRCVQPLHSPPPASHRGARP
ncbi:MAG: hypothetical protein U0R64_07470 [Candidatus Nanopelagicales bacterium]